MRLGWVELNKVKDSLSKVSIPEKATRVVSLTTRTRLKSGNRAKLPYEPMVSAAMMTPSLYLMEKTDVPVVIGY